MEQTITQNSALYLVQHKQATAKAVRSSDSSRRSWRLKNDWDVAEALLGRGAIILVARSVRNTLEIVSAKSAKSISQSWIWMRNSAGSRS
jgi:hypothetical protein